MAETRCNGETHYACKEQIEKHGEKTECCGCTGHKCKEMAETNEEIMKEFKQTFPIKEKHINCSCNIRASYTCDCGVAIENYLAKSFKGFLKRALTAKDAEHKKEIADMLDTYTKGGKFRIGYQSGKEEANAEWEKHFDEMEIRYKKELETQSEQWEKRLNELGTMCNGEVKALNNMWIKKLAETKRKPNKHICGCDHCDPPTNLNL